MTSFRSGLDTTVEQRAELRRIMRQELRHHHLLRAVQVVVRAFALTTILACVFAFAWWVMPVVPISVFIVLAFGAAVGLLFVVTGPGWPTRHRARKSPGHPF